MNFDPNLLAWLEQVASFPIDKLEAIPGDASFRRYFRLQSGQASYIVMDASKQTDSFKPFIAISKALSALGVTVPEVLAEDAEKSYMLISDFGDNLYLNTLNAVNADSLYKTALDSLAVLQACPGAEPWTIPAFDQAFMLRELGEFQNWFLEGYLKLDLSPAGRSLLQTTYQRLALAASQQVQVFMHRDYHSANLMVLPGKQVGILDFQDACWGPVTYDLVSLLRDCYIAWPDQDVTTWLSYYHYRLQQTAVLRNISLEQFIEWFDWMGIQRHLKAIFIFARKYLRDHNANYLQHIPRALNYVLKITARYPQFNDFHQMANEWQLPQTETRLELVETA